MKHSNHSIKSSEREDRILQALAGMLEYPQRVKITTAALAKQSGISESAIYRCFSNKSHMFAALIEFIEKTLFVLINKILQEEQPNAKQIENLLLLLLGFSQKNPGMTRILIGDALVNENDHLQLRIHQLHDRLETTLKQALRFAVSEQRLKADVDIAAQANLFMCFVIGRWYQFVNSGFRRDPLANWETQRLILLPKELL
ncbi:nucleoid occlusion factor SlmA [Nitrosomonas sp. Is35]|uniref:nucleoid occlusion factor SlmA n=1 Tax=Nitrosomonas sp. Is35 TaxID=3080534 RepID=UPI00294AED9D|nr:nucleoid occlusion factor SlmA [Nitrosomonas sp. Is35]MDV6346398.1 nucleoid occlusion factor SlmA [Nitrosomonas sp. Is35]